LYIIHHLLIWYLCVQNIHVYFVLYTLMVNQQSAFDLPDFRHCLLMAQNGPKHVGGDICGMFPT
jgi:hypothetical protein